MFQTEGNLCAIPKCLEKMPITVPYFGRGALMWWSFALSLVFSMSCPLTWGFCFCLHSLRLVVSALRNISKAEFFISCFPHSVSSSNVCRWRLQPAHSCTTLFEVILEHSLDAFCLVSFVHSYLSFTYKTC